MKKFLLFAIVSTLVAGTVQAQNEPEDKSQRPSPPATVSQTIAGGVSVKIDYSQPAVKGRTIGKELAPYGQVWRTGANEATTFTVSAPVTVEGKTLPAGTYDLFTIPTDGDWTIILNSELTLPNGKPTWGAYTYHQDKDVLRVTVPSGKSSAFTEKMTFTIDKSGKVSLVWGDKKVDFQVAKG